jgi:hypothetical protein
MIKKSCLLLILILCLFSERIYGLAEIQPEVVQALIPKLNTERIAYFFGNCAVEPIQVSPLFAEHRITSLHSVNESQKIMRTLAMVSFHLPVEERLVQVHQAITQGQPIGAALKKSGWMIDKEPVFFGSVPLSSSVKEWMHETAHDHAAVHIYHLKVFKNAQDEKVLYCTIIEVHSPQYLNEQWLEALYPHQYTYFSVMSEESQKFLQQLNVLISLFPSTLCYSGYIE